MEDDIDSQPPALPLSLPLPQHRSGFINTEYIGDNAQGQIIWSYNQHYRGQEKGTHIVETLDR